MIKESFTIKRDSWHCKMMSYIWNLQPYDFSHICPYFWLSIINLFIVIPLFLIKEPLRYICRGISHIIDFFDGLEARKLNQMIARAKVDPVYRAKLAAQCARQYKRFMYQNQMYSYENADLRNQISNDRDKIELKEREARRLRERKQRENQKQTRYAKEKINGILKVLKPVIQVVLVLVGLALAYVIGYALYNVGVYIVHVPAVAWKNVGIILLAILSFSVFIFILLLLFNQMKRIPCPSEKTQKYFLIPLMPIIWLLKGLFTLGEVIVQMIKNNCPSIDWE